ncbi:MAG: SCP2 sterol-binding domain-containing protein [Verrucomicrobia bacterium]|nr:SCP2 sterol-binding domain-containing protein [Cytophagales bacterium]
MTLQEITTKITQLAEKSPDFLGGSSLKFVFPEGNVHIDNTGKVSNGEQEADCSLLTSLEDLEKIMAGDLNPMQAVMFGKLKIKGDMSVAMKLQSILS